MDIHDRARKLQRALQRLDASHISKENKDLIKQFEGYLTQEEYSAGRRQKYVEQLTKIASWLDKPFKDASKPDIIDIMVKVGEQGYKEWTKHDYKVTLKVFFKWLRFGSIESDEYPVFVVGSGVSLKGRTLSTSPLPLTCNIERPLSHDSLLRSVSSISLIPETYRTMLVSSLLGSCSLALNSVAVSVKDR